jgi:demethylmenaquinone methyltransferase / 2-methoxy-6-polyprenyl-1,4-benzoquinol methylase
MMDVQICMMKKNTRHLENPFDLKRKGRPLYRIFAAVPPSYDLINRIFTLRLDERWRKIAARDILAGNPARIMDLCTGTGDLAVRLAKMTDGKTEIIGYDYSQPMLDLAHKKAVRAGMGKIRFVPGDAAEMPFLDNCFDSIGIAFAFRNLTFNNHDTERFLKEIHRVLKPGGPFVIVESSQPRYGWLKFLFRLWTQFFVYPVGSIVSGNKPAYKYLAYSVINYYEPEEICKLLKEFGFREVNFKRLTWGISALHIAVK